jgi:hypothetical protein
LSEQPIEFIAVLPKSMHSASPATGHQQQQH